MTTDQPILTCSLESADSRSPLNGPDFGLSGLLKLTPIARGCLSDTGRSPQTSETCEISNQARLERLTWLQQDFLANLSQLPGNGVEIQTKDSYGLNALASCARFDPDTQSLRTFQGSLRLTEAEPSTESLATFPRSGMIVSGIVYQLPPLVAFTEETGCGYSQLIPTPTACDHKGSGRLRLERGPTNNLRDWFKINYGFLYPPVRLVEWLMGYPIDHTDSSEPDTPSSRKLPTKSSKPLQPKKEKDPNRPF